MTGGIIATVIAATGGLDTGWTFYTPLSSGYANTNVFLASLAVFITGFSSILTGLNFLVTIHKMRAPGMTWFRLPPLYLGPTTPPASSLSSAHPSSPLRCSSWDLSVCGGVGVFDPALGGDPILFQHLFWYYSHPAVYIMILPGMGVISEVVCCFSKNRVFGYPFIAFSSVGIAVIGFLVWGHHLFLSGQSFYASTVLFLHHHARGRPIGHQDI